MFFHLLLWFFLTHLVQRDFWSVSFQQHLQAYKYTKQKCNYADHIGENKQYYKITKNMEIFEDKLQQIH